MWEWRDRGRSQQADKDLSGAPIWGEQEVVVGTGQPAWQSGGTVSGGTHAEEVSSQQASFPQPVEQGSAGSQKKG